ncbi:hypothetical protein [Caloranaerobacter ferrireducens]|nr:hypothetical protein [Caloranaerobacter ferrireducens]
MDYIVFPTSYFTNGYCIICDQCDNCIGTYCSYNCGCDILV